MATKGGNTKYGHLIDRNGSDSNSENGPGSSSDADTEPAITVNRHTVAIDDQRNSHGYEYGLDWLFDVETGIVQGYYVGHWLEGKSQSDPMLSPSWDDVPAEIKQRLREELNVDELEANVPAHYTGGL
jgi:hypothetical protein